MPNTPGGSRRPKWLNAYRLFTTVALSTLVVMGGFALNELSDMSDRSFAPITTKQADKVTTAASYLETVGFANPVYMGIKPAIEGEYPTFRVEAIGGKTLEVFIRTTENGGLEIQPTMTTGVVTSAEDFARLAAKAVSDWKDIPPNIKPRTDGNWGEYEARKDAYKQLSKYYVADANVTTIDETSGWPRK